MSILGKMVAVVLLAAATQATAQEPPDEAVAPTTAPTPVTVQKRPPVEHALQRDEPAPASPVRQYGQRGIMEVGGGFAFSHTMTTVEATESTSTDIVVSPGFGYFVMPNFEMTLSLFFEKERKTPGMGASTSETDVGVTAGAAYFVPVGAVFLGPEAGLGYFVGKVQDKTGSVNISGVVITGNIALKAPIGSGGVVEVGAGVRYFPFDLESGSNTASGSTTRLGLDLGFSVFF